MFDSDQSHGQEIITVLARGCEWLWAILNDEQASNRFTDALWWCGIRIEEGVEYFTRTPKAAVARFRRTGADVHVATVTLGDGRVVEDVAIVNCSVIACIRGKPFVWFHGADVVDLEVTHRRWGAGYRLTR